MSQVIDPLDYQGLVISIAKKIARDTRLSRHMDELIAFGQQGLLEAKARFDPSRGNTFSTYSYHRIRGAILDGCRLMGWISRRRRKSVNAAIIFNEQQLARSEDAPKPPTDLEGIGKDLDDIFTSASFSFLLCDEVVERTPSEAESPEEQLGQMESLSWIRQQVERLPAEDRAIIEMSFFEEQTLDQIGEHLGCSKSWACRRRGAALKKLRSLLAMSPDDLP